MLSFDPGVRQALRLESPEQDNGDDANKPLNHCQDRLGCWAHASPAAGQAICVSDFISLGCGHREGVRRKLAVSRPRERARVLSRESAHGSLREVGLQPWAHREPAACASTSWPAETLLLGPWHPLGPTAISWLHC